MTSSKCVQYDFVKESIRSIFKLQNIYNLECKFSKSCVTGQLIENSATKFAIAFKYILSTRLRPMAAVHSTKPVCSPDNSTISGTI